MFHWKKTIKSLDFNWQQYLFKVAIPLGWILCLFVSNTYFQLLSDVMALKQTKAATFQY